MPKLIAVVLIAIASFTIGYGASIAWAEPKPVVSNDIVIPECVTEDSTNCIWHANEHGNRQGTDFVDVEGSTYLPQ